MITTARPPAPKRSFELSRPKRNALIINGSLAGICLVLLMPIAVTVLFTFEQEEDITRIPPVLLPCDTPTARFDPLACRWSLEGYARVFFLIPSPTAPFGFTIANKLFTNYVPNSIIYASTAGLLVVVLSAMSGFVFARYPFPGRDFSLTFILILSGMPWMSDLLALYQISTALNRVLPVYDERVFLVVVYTGFFLPLSIWIAKSFFDAIPRELEEAALIDGCSATGGFARITLPLATPGMMAIFLLTFVGVWNEFIAGYLLIGKNNSQPVMFGLYDYVSTNLINPQVVAAACVVVALPVIVVFLLARRSFFQAMVEGAIKG